MTQYLHSGPMFFGPPRMAREITIGVGERGIVMTETHCDHIGTKFLFNGHIWKCECGAKVEPPAKGV